MDDSCAVCADSLEWVAYGPCGHRDVCSTCIIRLRFICDDRRCCICKSEANIIFVTKALGDYTRLINDFSKFPAGPTEGQVGSYWYHEGTQSFFDDGDQYKMVKAMCRLSCNVCDKKDEQRNGGSRKTGEFNSVEQLKRHLFHRHRLFMCSLCLEGRKIFISEQKLYNSAQLNQHVKTGDSVVDGSESERGGFMGHPMCEFCQNPFYGDNELYLHMSTEHFLCHICQRRHPGQYEYYKNYDDLEIHFHREHFLCEDEACLEKKFVVFANEAEFKKHSAMEHGGHMSRSKRNAALQIPVSFQYLRNEGRNRLCRGHRENSDASVHQLSATIQYRLETANAERSHSISSTAQVVPTESESSSGNGLVSGQNYRGGLMEESSFPPLPIASSSREQRSRNPLQALRGNTIAAKLRSRNIVKVLNTSRTLPAAINHPDSPAINPYQSRPVPNSGFFSSSSSSSSSQIGPATVHGHVPASEVSVTEGRALKGNGILVSDNFLSSSRTSSSTSRVSSTSVASKLSDRGTVDNSTSNISLVPGSQDETHPSSQPLPKVKDVKAANRALVEKIRAALELDEDRYAAFKLISADYRDDLIDTGKYLAHVHLFGLSHLVLELARLCPDAKKQKELLEIHESSMRRNGSNENGLSNNTGQSKSRKSSKKGKEKCEDHQISSSENGLVDNRGLEVTNLQLSMDEHSSAKGKSKVLVDEQPKPNLQMESIAENGAQSAGGGSKKIVGPGGGGNKPRKKASKFLRNRLGDTSSAAPEEADNCDAGPDIKEVKRDANKAQNEVLPVRGAWKNGGGRRLVAMTQRDYRK